MMSAFWQTCAPRLDMSFKTGRSNNSNNASSSFAAPLLNTQRSVAAALQLHLSCGVYTLCQSNKPTASTSEVPRPPAPKASIRQLVSQLCLVEAITSCHGACISAVAWRGPISQAGQQMSGGLFKLQLKLASRFWLRISCWPDPQAPWHV